MRKGIRERAAWRIAAGGAAMLALCSCSLISTVFPWVSASPEMPEDAEPASGRIKLLDSQRLDPRLVLLTLQTPALDGPTRVQVLLPDHYDANPATRYPVVYLLQGAIDDYTAWIREGNAEALTAGYPMIIVMPDAGNEGFYSDWFNGGAFGTPQWETYHIHQLIPWIDAHYRTIASRRGRAVGGVSMGGFGALSYAARHPDLFAAVVSFSGLVNNNSHADRNTIPDTVFGPRSAQEVRWRGHNPWDLASNLRGMDVTLYTRNGLPGKDWLGIDPAEIFVHQQNLDLHQQLLDAQVPHHWDDHGAGAHKWPTWQEDLVGALQGLSQVFATPPPPPVRVSFKTIDPEYRIYDWHVAIERPALEFSTLEDAGPQGFRLSGSGAAVVLTPPVYTPLCEYAVTLDSGDSTTRSVLRSSARGRLEIHLLLGPGNPDQQYSDAASKTGGTHVYTVTAVIEATAPVASTH
jgi:S-formylglutathione hydrolase FrmB